MNDHDERMMAEKMRMIEKLSQLGLLDAKGMDKLLKMAFTLGDPEAKKSLQRIIEVASVAERANPNPARPCVTTKDGLACDIPLGVQENGVPFGLALSELAGNVLATGPVRGGKTATLTTIILAIAALFGHLIKMLIVSVKRDYTWLAKLPGFLVMTADELRLGFFEPMPIPQNEHAVNMRVETNSKILRQTQGTQLASQLEMSKLQREYLLECTKGTTYIPPTLSEFLEYLERVGSRYKRSAFSYDFYHRFYERMQNLYNVFPKTFTARIGHPLHEILQRHHVVLELSDQAMETETIETMLTWILNNIHTFQSSHNLRSMIPRIIVVVDEGSFLFNAKREAKADEELVLSKIVTRSREFGISYIVAAQRPTNVAEYLKANSATQMVVGGLQDAADKNDFCRSTGFNSFGVYDLLSRLRPMECLIRDPRWARPILVTVKYPPFDKNIALEEVRQRMAPLLKELHYVPGPSAEAAREARAELCPEEWGYVLNVHYSPDASSAMRQAQLELSRDAELCVRRKLERRGFLDYVRFPHEGRGRPRVRTVLTPHFFRAMGIDAPASPGKGGPLHKCLQAEVARYFTAQGFKATIEFNVNGKSVDILLEKPGQRPWAFEVATTPKHETQNVIKDLLVAEVDRVIVGCTNTEVLSEVRNRVDRLNAEFKAKVETQLVTKYLRQPEVQP